MHDGILRSQVPTPKALGRSP
ncbi:MAG: hypothetical protein EZS28_033010, partial [Streblomastix strix]